MDATAGSQRRRRQHGRETRRDQVLSTLLASPIGRAMISVGMRAEVTPADAVAPPDSVLDVIVRSIRLRTDLPPLLGVASALAIIAAAMAQAESTVRWPNDGHDIELALWITALASSGAGKTWIRSVVSDGLGLAPRELPDAGSGPAYLDALAAAGGRAFWPRDEYGYFLRSLADGGPRMGMRDLLLRTFDHTELSHVTRTRGEVRIARPVLTILGTAVDSTWGDCVDPQMLVDGLCARHLFVVTNSRELSVPRFPRAQIVADIAAAARGLSGRVEQKTVFDITPEAAAVYDSLWLDLVAGIGENLDAAYVRRITWSAARYAAIYHVILGREGTRIGVHAMRWAWRMVMVHCHSTKLVLAAADRTLGGRIERIASWVTEQATSGIDLRAPSFIRRVISRFHRDLNTVHEARQIVELILSGTGRART